jgi:hypothetical protein
MLNLSRADRRSAVHDDADRRPLVAMQPRRPSCGVARKASFLRAPVARLNAICPYYTMFPLDFPLSRLVRANPAEWVLDPFCGRGTTLFAARLLGLPCVGIDSNPVAAAISAAKIADAGFDDVVERATTILRSSGSPADVPQGEFWTLCFHESTLRDICLVREQLMISCSEPAEVLLRALMLGILHGPARKGQATYLSNQMPRTYATKPAAAIRFWKRLGMAEPPAVDVLDAISRRAGHVLTETPRPVPGVVYRGDARLADRLPLPVQRFSWVVTSPPYFGLRTYQADQWLRNWFVGGPPEVVYGEDGQVPHRVGEFSAELAKVWCAIGSRCVPGARLIVRFGHLPSIPLDARELLRDSLASAQVGWRIYRWADAGLSSNGKRQARQFGRPSAAPASEVDMYARLED